MLRRQLRGVLVELFDDAKSVGAIRRADPIIAENSHVDTGFILFLEQAVKIENRPRRFRMEPTLGHKVRVTIDDHKQLPPKSTLGVGELNVKFPTRHLGTSAKLVNMRESILALLWGFHSPAH